MVPTQAGSPRVNLSSRYSAPRRGQLHGPSTRSTVEPMAAPPSKSGPHCSSSFHTGRTIIPIPPYSSAARVKASSASRWQERLMGGFSSPTHTSLPVTRSTAPAGPDTAGGSDELRPQLGSHLVQLPVKNIGAWGDAGHLPPV